MFRVTNHNQKTIDWEMNKLTYQKTFQESSEPRDANKLALFGSILPFLDEVQNNFNLVKANHYLYALFIMINFPLRPQKELYSKLDSLQHAPNPSILRATDIILLLMEIKIQRGQEVLKIKITNQLQSSP